ncbi:MAG: metal ABC transporter permease [Solirubrobacteraceae bacterium]|jgi:ABC-type Mn2+/Zn2+ transport system permease subunit|nr:metal ABC transporter permease [Solirubrobacteraceae bacterium]
MIDWLTDPLAQRIVLRGIAELTLLGVVSGALGCWVVLAGRSYSAESLAHAMLPGLVVASLLGFSLLLGGALGLLAGALGIALVGRLPRLDGDVAVSVVITSLFGLGVLLGLAPEVPAGLSDLLFGDVLGVTDADLVLTAALAVAMTAVLALVHHSLLAVGFDRLSAPALGRSPAAFDVLLALLLALATLVAVQALGNLLVVAMLIGPAASARLLCRRIVPMMALATAIAAGASVAGLYLSYHAELAAGASVTLALVAAFVLASLIRAVVRASGTAVPVRS